MCLGVVRVGVSEPLRAGFYSSTSIRDVSAPAVFHVRLHAQQLGVTQKKGDHKLKGAKERRLRPLLFFDLYSRCLRPRGIPCSSSRTTTRVNPKKREITN